MADESCNFVEDGVIVPYEDDMDQAFTESANSGIQMIIGLNSDEWNYFCIDSVGDSFNEKIESWQEDNEYIYQDALSSIPSDRRVFLEELLKQEEGRVPDEYAADPVIKDALAKSGFITANLRYELYDYIDRFADAGGKIYAYYWTVPSTLDTMFKSAVHAVELSYVFNNPHCDIYSGEVDKTASDRIQEAWVGFAESGDPSVTGAEWIPYQTSDRHVMVMTPDGWSCESDPLRTSRELLTKAYGDEPYIVWK